MEFRVEILGGALRGAKPEELEALLNQVAEDGWSLGQLSFKPNTSQLWVILQRKEDGRSPRPHRRSWMADWS
ncbi:MAG: hypothetical protein E4G99_08970 [Anaerolineales bacterium]|nr:MAG: hypothetical protein E4G99_08970 [Anaerolineales bacterium]